MSLRTRSRSVRRCRVLREAPLMRIGEYEVLLCPRGGNDGHDTNELLLWCAGIELGYIYRWVK